MNFESWRDFSLEGEHDPEDAHDRYEKRWMIKENDRKCKVCVCVCVCLPVPSVLSGLSSSSSSRFLVSSIHVMLCCTCVCHLMLPFSCVIWSCLVSSVVHVCVCPTSRGWKLTCACRVCLAFFQPPQHGPRSLANRTQHQMEYRSSVVL